MHSVFSVHYITLSIMGDTHCSPLLYCRHYLPAYMHPLYTYTHPTPTPIYTHHGAVTPISPGGLPWHGPPLSDRASHSHLLAATHAPYSRHQAELLMNTYRGEAARGLICARRGGVRAWRWRGGVRGAGWWQRGWHGHHTNLLRPDPGLTDTTGLCIRQAPPLLLHLDAREGEVGIYITLSWQSRLCQNIV